MVTQPIPVPATAVLMMEVSDTTLAFDRVKAGLYARAEVPEYETISPLIAPNATLLVANLLPRARFATSA